MTKDELRAAIAKCRKNLSQCQDAYKAYRFLHPPLTPPSPPPTSGGPPSGRLVFHDWAETDNPTPPWWIVTDHWSNGDWVSSDQHVRRVADACPHPRPISGGKSSYARELTADPDLQSEWDAGEGGSATRTQLRLDTSTPEHGFYEGQRKVVWFSMKLDPTYHPLHGTADDTSGGNSSQVMQIMGSNVPVIGMTEGTNGIALVHAPPGGGSASYWPVFLSRGVWVQIALDIFMSGDSTKGFMRLWVDKGGGLVPATDKIAGIQTLDPPDTSSGLSIGPYQVMPRAWATASGVVKRRYANIAVVEV